MQVQIMNDQLQVQKLPERNGLEKQPQLPIEQIANREQQEVESYHQLLQDLRNRLIEEICTCLMIEHRLKPPFSPEPKDVEIILSMWPTVVEADRNKSDLKLIFHDPVHFKVALTAYYAIESYLKTQLGTLLGEN